MTSTSAPDRARDFVRELETYWKFQTTHPDAPSDRELVLYLIDANGSRQRVSHVTVFDSNSLRITHIDGGVIILQIEQCSFSVRREKKTEPSKKAQFPANIIQLPPQKTATHVIIR